MESTSNAKKAKVKERVDETILHLMKGRVIESIDASRANIIEIHFTDGSMLEFETEHLGSGLYGNVLSQYKIGPTPGTVIEPQKGPLDLLTMRKANIGRCEAQDGFNQVITEWNVLEWAGAMAGEAGEATNAAKKIRRGDYGAGGTMRYQQGRDNLARELGDMILYADLTAAREQIDLSDAIRKAFNEKSIEISSPHRL